MLRGNYPATVDGKGRLKIPAAFKTAIEEEFGQEFYVTSLDGSFVRIYPFNYWREIEEKLAGLPSLNKSKKKFLDRTNYWGQTSRMDGQGRVLIPSLLRDAAGTKGQVVVMGYLKYLDVWNAVRFREHLEKYPFTEEDEQSLGGLGI